MFTSHCQEQCAIMEHLCVGLVGYCGFMRFEKVEQFAKEAWSLDEAVNLCMDDVGREELRRRLYFARQDLSNEIEKFALMWAGRVGLVAGGGLFLALIIANLPLVEAGVSLTWEILCSMGFGWTIGWLAKGRISLALCNRYLIGLTR